jgi:hypothetical protein
LPELEKRLSGAAVTGAWSPLGPLAKKPASVGSVNVLIAADGTHVKSPMGDCFAPTGDGAALTVCVKRAKADPALSGIDLFFLAAAPGTAMQEVVGVVDVVSRDFPRVAFGLATPA